MRPLTPLATNAESLKPLKVTITAKDFQADPPQGPLKSTVLSTKVLTSPLMKYQLAVRPGLFNVDNLSLNVTLLVLKRRSSHTHYQCQIDIQMASCDTAVPSKDHTLHICMGNAQDKTLFTACWHLAKGCAEAEFKFTQAKLTFRPIEIVDPRSLRIAVRQCNTLLAMLNARAFSDCQLVTPEPDAKPILVSRAILANASPFFHLMFAGDWSKYVDRNESVKFSWPALILIPCLIHIYSGWLPNHPLPTLPSSVKDMVENHGFALDRFGHVEWNQVVDMAEMLELLHLAQAAHLRVEECMRERIERIKKALDAPLDDDVDQQSEVGGNEESGRQETGKEE